MSERIACNPEIERRQEYTRRIVKAVNYKGNADHEDVPSILCKFQEEIVNELTDKIVQQLKELKAQEYDDSDEEPEWEDIENVYEDGRSQGRYEAYYNAIEIVKKGCASDETKG